MEQEYASAASYLLSKANERSRYIVGIAGVPGSGKSTTCHKIVELINQEQPSTSVLVPMDGFHYYRHQLDQMPDPLEAHKRRGAPFTFWAEGLINLVTKIRAQATDNSTIYAPSFDHALKDPKENDITIEPRHKIIILEGNYLLLDEKPWNSLSSLCDELWFIDCDIDIAMKRVVARHKVAFGMTEEAAWDRVNTNDRINAEYIIKHCGKPSRTIHSKQDE